MLRTFVPLLGVPFLEKILGFTFRLPQAYIILQICVSLAYVEILVARFWFYRAVTQPGSLKFLEILDELKPAHEKGILAAVKLIGGVLTIAGTLLLVSIVQWLARHTEPDDYVAFISQAVWICLYVATARTSIWVMILAMAVAIGAGTVLYQQMTAYITSLENETSIKRLLATYNKLMSSILLVRPLVSMTSQLNNLIVIPFCGTALSLAFYQTDDIEAKAIAVILVFSGLGYALRGYAFTGFCSLLYAKSMSVHNRMASLIARQCFTVADRQVLFTIITDIAGDLNHLIFTDENDGKINQLDLLQSLLDTLEFFILSIQFRSRLF